VNGRHARYRLRAAIAGVIVGIGLSGCAAVGHRSKAADPAVIARAYNSGVRDAMAQLSAESGVDPRAIWVAPVVQEVWMPPRVTRGVFIPGHREWVVIHPAEWHRQFGRPVEPAPPLPLPPPGQGGRSDPPGSAP
jgi:hypothetical protein